MINGAVDASLDAVVELTVAGADAGSARLRFVVDTGFTGALTLPSSMVAALELPTLGMGRAWLGDGSLSQFAICQARVDWDGIMRLVEVEVAETMPLLGMQLLEGHELRIDVLPGGGVSITGITPPPDASR